MKRFLAVALAVVALAVAQVASLDAQAKTKTMNATGTVKSVSGTSLTIAAAGGKEMTFAVDNTTKFVGRGLSTKARTGPITAPDAVGENDRVTVTYHDMGGSLHAANVRITNKAAVKK